MKSDFADAVSAIEKINFMSSSLEEINVFETTIRYLGGFLAAYDLSEHQYPALLRKAVELGDMLYVAFDTPNHMPITRWKFRPARDGIAQQVAPTFMLLAEIGSLTLEFSRLSQLTGNNKYYDAVQRITDVLENQQDKTKIPGLWPVVINAKELDFTSEETFTLGGMSDSAYEYLPKMYLLLGGGLKQYRDLYVKALGAMKRHLFYRPMTQHRFEILIPGNAHSDGHQGPLDIEIEPQAQHLGCFVAGMVGLAARVFSLPNDMTTARALLEGCLWAYESSPGGIMPEIMRTTICSPRKREKGDDSEHFGACEFEQDAWYQAISILDKSSGILPAEKVRQERLAPGVTRYEDKRYILRPEAIESVFLLYRITGDQTLRDRAWDMFSTITKLTQTDIAHAALDDVIWGLGEESGMTKKRDRMESFWLAETLKYFYLLYSQEDLVSLDEWVFNTEAHPLQWRMGGKK